MYSNLFRRTSRIATLACAAVLLVAMPAASSPAVAAGGVPDSGIVCTNGTLAGSTRSFALKTDDGYILLPDGNTVYMWSFDTPGTTNFQYPGPVLCANQGETVAVTLTNTLPEATSLIFPGQDNVLANGTPAFPQTNGALAPEAAATSGSVTYSFVAGEPGTYMYSSGSGGEKQVQMGLVGGIVVRPTMGAAFAYNRADTQFNPATEYIELLSEIDPYLHQAVELGQFFDMNAYHPRYFLINGRSFPDTIAPNNAPWLPSQPYGSLAHIHPYTAGAMPALMRYIGVGTSDYPFHPHGNSAKVIGRDGRALAGAGGEDLAYDKFSIPVGPGQTWDATFTWKDAEGYNPTTKPVPITIPQVGNTTFGQYYSGSPYLGNTGTLPVGSENYNVCGEYYHVAHNHALVQITSWGQTMSGMMTYTRIDPPMPNNCPAIQ